MAEAEAAGRKRSVAAVVEPIEVEPVGEIETDSDTGTPASGYVVENVTPEQSQADATVGVAERIPKRRCSICGQPGHTARTCDVQDAATRAPRKPSKDAIGTLAPMVVGTANFCVVTTFGAPCGLTELELKLLIPSVQRSLERLPAGAATKAAVIIDPLIICTVLVMWARRIAAIKDAEAKQQYQVQPFEQARASGFAGTTYSESAPGRNEETNGAVTDSPNGQTGSTYTAPSHLREAFDDKF